MVNAPKSLCLAISEAVKIVPDGVEINALCELPLDHRYDHYDEVLNYQWANERERPVDAEA